jgi:ATP-dependent DNA helicase RecG
MITLKTPIEQLAKRAKVSPSALTRLSITTVRDLIFHFPFRYEDVSSIQTIADLKINEAATIRGRIELINTKRTPRRKMYITEALVSDGTGTVKCVWFNQKFIGKTLKIGDIVYLSGNIAEDYVGVQMTSPTYEKETRNKKDGNTLHTGRIVPMYPTTAGVTPRQLRSMMEKALTAVGELSDWLTDDMRRTYNLMEYTEALRQIHFPETAEARDQAMRRLQFDELLVIQLYTQQLRAQASDTPCYEVPFAKEYIQEFVAGLGYKLTNAQRRAAWEVVLDMQRAAQPMNRLLEGDVGSGKTIVAAITLLNTFYAAVQSVLIAPTEILAYQHFEGLTELFAQTNMRIGLLSRGAVLYHDTGCEQTITLKKKELLEKIAKNEIDLIIGTHAVLQDSVEFAHLGLIIIDEQHRFGVKQRQYLKERMQASARMPHFLSMTATPIPRSLALALYGDLDLSIINEMPPGRKPVETQVIEPQQRTQAYEQIRAEIAKGHQCFVICPLIEESDKLGVTSVQQEFERLTTVFDDVTVGMLHGKLKKDEKADIMQQFVENKLQILIATSVIEVGVNVPNATIMLIEGAERFGMAQLHQFRGRVGRSATQSYCLVCTDNKKEEILHRLRLFAQTRNGFELAQYDLDNRGAGDMYGYRQSGESSLQLANLNDHELILLAQRAAQELLAQQNIGFKLPAELQQRVDHFTQLIDLE